MNTPQVGATYRHYKGHDYKIIANAYNEATVEPVVVYQALYDTPDLGSQPTFVRPLTSFMETVTIDGREQPRFTYVAP